MPRETDFKQTLCADIDGFSLHAAVRCGADDRQALEQLCRYVTRPALANERVQTNAAEQVVLKLKTPWRDGTTHLVMSPLDFMQRWAARAIEERPSVARAKATPTPHPFGVRVTSLREVSEPPLREPRRAGTLICNFGHAARAGGAARGAARARVAGAGHTARRMRGELRTSPPGAAELGQAAQARIGCEMT